MSEYIVIGTIIAAFAVAAVLSYFFTPPVKNFAHKVGAIDVPKDARRMHKKPIPRLGGLAIYGGFLCSILIFGQLDEKDKPTEIPGLLIETEEEKWEWDAAKKRREMRMKRREEGF